MSFKFMQIFLTAMLLVMPGEVCWADESGQKSGGKTVEQANSQNVDYFDLDPVVVTATRVDSSSLDVPASVTVITGDEIAKKNVSSVQEILKNEVGILHDATNDSLQMRGRNSDNILVLVDGVPSFNPFNSSANFDSISVSNIEKIEVVRGPASSLYGGNAVAGVVNIITKNPDKNSVSIRLSGGSDNTWMKDISAYQKVNDKFGFGMGWEAKDSDGYMQRYARVASSSATPSGTIGYGNVKPLPDGKGGYQYMVGERGERGYDKDNYWLKFDYAFDKSKNLSYAVSYYTYEGETTGAKSYITDANGNPLYAGSVQLPDGSWVRFSESNFTDYVNRKKVATHSLRYKDTDNDFAINLGFSDVRDSGYNSGSYLDKSRSGTLAEYPGKTYNMDVQKIWKDMGKHTLVSGFTLRQDEMDYKNWNLAHWGDKKSKSQLNYASGGKDRSFGLFLQDEYAFSSRWKLFAGLRYDQYDMKNGYSDWYTGTQAHMKYPSESYNEISPKLALEMKPDDKSSIYVSYGHSFRPPDLYQLYRLTSYSSTSYYYLGNPYLKPETSDTFELGFKRQIAEKASLGLTLFQSNTKDAIVAVEYAAGTFPGAPDPLRNVRAYTNVDEERRRGVELSMRYKFDDKFNVFANYTWQQGKYTAGASMQQFISDIPKHLFHFGINYNYKRWYASLDATYSSQRNSSTVPTNIYYSSYDPYFIANFRLGYKVNNNVQLAFSVNNLLDRDYYENYIAPGRTWAVEARFAI